MNNLQVNHSTIRRRFHTYQIDQSRLVYAGQLDAIYCPRWIETTRISPKVIPIDRNND